ncbi:MAG: sugar ABC transporter permease [Lachnospiraceae bacterium]|nr:sugar ABC transporter permease [Lachnospiraceae bacterium]
MSKLLNKHAGYVFLIPWLLGFLLLTLIPLVLSFYYSFTDFLMIDEPHFVGLDNYIRMFTTDFHFRDAVRVTLLYVFISVPLQIFASLVLAFILNKSVPGLAGIRAAFYVPSLLGGSVAVAILWRQIFGTNGIFNVLLYSIGLEQFSGISWIADPRYALGSLVVLRVWQFGSPMIIFLAAIKQVPTSYLEAATVDGANSFTRIVKIILPLISPIILFNLVMQIISAFRVFTEAFVISGGDGGVMNSLLVYTIHIYNIGFRQMRMGYASALSWFLVLMVAVFTVLAFIMTKKHVHYDE